MLNQSYSTKKFQFLPQNLEKRKKFKLEKDRLQVEKYLSKKIIETNVFIKENEWITDLGDIEEIHGDLTLHECVNLKSLGKLKTIHGSFLLENCESLESLGELQTIHGNLHISGNKNFKNFGNLKMLNGTFYLSNIKNSIKTLNIRFKILKDFQMYRVDIKKLYFSDVSLQSNIVISHCFQLAKISGIKVFNSISISNSGDFLTFDNQVKINELSLNGFYTSVNFENIFKINKLSLTITKIHCINNETNCCDNIHVNQQLLFTYENSKMIKASFYGKRKSNYNSVKKFNQYRKLKIV